MLDINVNNNIAPQTKSINKTYHAPSSTLMISLPMLPLFCTNAINSNNANNNVEQENSPHATENTFKLFVDTLFFIIINYMKKLGTLSLV